MGEIKEVKKFQNGNVSLFLQNGNKVLTIKNFISEEYDELNNNKNKQIRVYNVKREATELFYSAADMTVIYEKD